jgi:hypothetical protein
MTDSSQQRRGFASVADYRLADPADPPPEALRAEIAGQIARICAELKLPRRVSLGPVGPGVGQGDPADVIVIAVCNGGGGGADALDLVGADPLVTARLIGTHDLGAEGWLVTCLGLLNQIDREDIAAAIANLHALCDRYLAVDVSLMPAGRGALASLIPPNAWIACFEAAGFRLVERKALRSPAGSTAEAETGRLAEYWAAANPYRVEAPGELLLFERDGPLPATAAERIDLIVDVAYRRRKRAEFGPAGGLAFTLSMHFPQEWSLLRPLLDVIPRDGLRLLMRRGSSIEPLRRAAIRGFLARRGICLVEYDHIDELPWAEIAGTVFVSGAESTAPGTHMQAFDLVTRARLQGCPTYMLQHGIWPRGFPENLVAFASERVMTWGRGESERLNGRRHRTWDMELPWGALDPDQELRIGSAKFCDQLISPFPPLDLRLGYDAQAFDRVVVLGSKNLRGRWGLGEGVDGFIDELVTICSSNPRTMFVVRPHPVDSVLPYVSLGLPNICLVDETISALADMPLNRIIPGIDLLVTSPSSFVVDAVSAGKPVFVYDTGQPIELQGIEALPLSGLRDALAAPDGLHGAEAQGARLQGLYAEGIDERFYRNFGEELLRRTAPRIDRGTAIAATMGHLLRQETEARRRAEQQNAELTWVLDELRASRLPGPEDAPPEAADGAEGGEVASPSEDDMLGAREDLGAGLDGEGAMLARVARWLGRPRTRG